MRPRTLFRAQPGFSQGRSRPDPLPTSPAPLPRQACTFELYLSYVVSHASWEPAYDVRVDSSTQGLSLTYYGAVRQSTGEDWVNCRVSLSTAQPGARRAGWGATTSDCQGERFPACFRCSLTRDPRFGAAVGGTPPSLPSRTFSLRSPHMQRTKGLGGRRSRAVPPVAMMQTRTLASTGLDGLKDYDDFAEELEMEGMPDARACAGRGGRRWLL